MSRKPTKKKQSPANSAKRQAKIESRAKARIEKVAQQAEILKPVQVEAESHPAGDVLPDNVSVIGIMIREDFEAAADSGVFGAVKDYDGYKAHIEDAVLKLKSYGRDVWFFQIISSAAKRLKEDGAELQIESYGDFDPYIEGWNASVELLFEYCENVDELYGIMDGGAEDMMEGLASRKTRDVLREFYLDEESSALTVVLNREDGVSRSITYSLGTEEEFNDDEILAMTSSVAMAMVKGGGLLRVEFGERVYEWKASVEDSAC